MSMRRVSTFDSLIRQIKTAFNRFKFSVAVMICSNGERQKFNYTLYSCYVL